jgi:acyl-coenzyme A thioesterase PaaI-like protein
MAESVWQNIDLTNARRLVEEGIPGVKRMGLRVLELEPRRVKLLMPLKGNENHIGMMYAAALFTVAEVPGGAIHLSTFDVTRYVPVVKQLDIRFRRPALTDVTFEVELSEEEVRRINRELEAQGKSDFVLNGEIKDAAGTVVAVTTATYQARRIG